MRVLLGLNAAPLLPQVMLMVARLVHHLLLLCRQVLLLTGLQGAAP
jgi:hypothetical protein